MQSAWRINRNIVECKDFFIFSSCATFRSINRNIVECKVVFKLVLDFYFRVLIETSWNVKTEDRTVTSDRSGRINRNIVECKDWTKPKNMLHRSVLIETSWNVKNVTFSIIVFPDLCINRNIVECKELSSLINSIQERRINRNIVECKVVGEYTSFIILSSINRNIVECKVWICISMKRFVLVLIETSWNVKEPSWICYEWKKECELPDILTLVF